MPNRDDPASQPNGQMLTTPGPCAAGDPSQDAILLNSLYIQRPERKVAEGARHQAICHWVIRQTLDSFAVPGHVQSCND